MFLCAVEAVKRLFNRTGKRMPKRVDDWLDEQPDG